MREMQLEKSAQSQLVIFSETSSKMPQSEVGSMQGKNTENMPSAVCASSMNKSLIFKGGDAPTM